MNRFIFKLPDLGEGTVSSEIVAWRVQVGQAVREDDPLVEMSTDKAVVEVPAPVSGTIVSLGGKPGDVIAVGAELVAIATQDHATQAPVVTEPQRVKASPSTRRRAKEAGVALEALQGSGPDGRIRKEDLNRALEQQPPLVRADTAEIRDEVPVIGVRRVIAQRMAEAKRTIPHFSYVEEVDVTELEALREHLNARRKDGEIALSFVPFIALALIGSLSDFAQINVRYDAERETLVRYRAVHLGIATQTSSGLKVPVLRNAQMYPLRELATEIARVAEMARNNTARREDLMGSTITVSSLGKLGGIASTPVINAPEVAIVGVNRATERPAVRRGQICVRRLMNLSSSFDHRFVDGADAAGFIQAMKERLEHPALLGIDKVRA